MRSGDAASSRSTRVAPSGENRIRKTGCGSFESAGSAASEPSVSCQLNSARARSGWTRKIRCRPIRRPHRLAGRTDPRTTTMFASRNPRCRDRAWCRARERVSVGRQSRMPVDPASASRAGSSRPCLSTHNQPDEIVLQAAGRVDPGVPSRATSKVGPRLCSSWRPAARPPFGAPDNGERPKIEPYRP